MLGKFHRSPYNSPNSTISFSHRIWHNCWTPLASWPAYHDIMNLAWLVYPWPQPKKASIESSLDVCSENTPSIGKHKRGSQYTLHSSHGSINLTLWNDGASVLFADNDFKADTISRITGKIYSILDDKRKKEFKGVRYYFANGAVRCYRYVHNDVDLHNQFIEYEHCDFRTRRKQMRVLLILSVWLLLAAHWDRLLPIRFVRGSQYIHCMV